jgi:hypothetical protein
LKVKTAAAEGETPLARFGGTVETIVGWAHAIFEPKRRCAATPTDALKICLDAACKYRFTNFLLDRFGRDWETLLRKRLKV